MRVLMTTDTVGGVWTYAIELTAALAPHGIEVVLAAMGPQLTLEQRSRAERLQLCQLFLCGRAERRRAYQCLSEFDATRPR